jgi:hypothetical protein
MFPSSTVHIFVVLNQLFFGRSENGKFGQHNISERCPPLFEREYLGRRKHGGRGSGPRRQSKRSKFLPSDFNLPNWLLACGVWFV